MTLYLGVVETEQALAQRVDQDLQPPPATFYGWLEGGEEVAEGVMVVAKINGVICGQGPVESLEGKWAFKVQVQAGEGCGSAGRIAIFEIDGQRSFGRAVWDNTRTQFLPLSSENLYLPLILK